MVFIVMGVSGSGKTAVGSLLAQRWNVPFYDADDFHNAANKYKMGVLRQPLTDEDRQPWLETLATNIKHWNDAGDAVLACSALKQRYRDTLSRSGNVQWIYLKGTADLLEERLKKRTDHFFPRSLLESQLAALEEPHEAILCDISMSLEEIVAYITASVNRQ